MKHYKPKAWKTCKEWKKAWYHRIKTEEPVAYRMLAAERQRYAETMKHPERRARRMASAEKARLKRKALLKANPQLREELNAKRRKAYAEKKRQGFAF